MDNQPDAFLPGYYPRRTAGGNFMNNNTSFPAGVPMASWGLVVGTIGLLAVLAFVFKGKVNF